MAYRSLGWRSRKSGRDGEAEVSPRRHFYSRTLSRDLPFNGKQPRRPECRSSWDSSSPMGTLPRSSTSPRQTLSSKNNAEHNERMTSSKLNSRNHTFSGTQLGPSLAARFSSQLPAYLHEFQNKKVNGTQNVNSNPIIHSNSQTMNKIPTEKQSMKQLVQLVNELESFPDENENFKMEDKPEQSRQINQAKLSNNTKRHPQGNGFNQVSQTCTNKQTPERSLSCTSTLTKHNLPPKPTSRSTHDAFQKQEANSRKTQISSPQNVFIPFSSDVPNNSYEKRTQNVSEMPKNLNQSAENMNIINNHNYPTQSDSKPKIYTSHINTTLKCNSSTFLNNMDPNSVLAKSHPYRKGKSENLKDSISLINDSRQDETDQNGHSRDINPKLNVQQTSNNRENRFQKLNSSRRSQSRESGHDVDFATNDSGTELNRLNLRKEKTPQPINSRHSNEMRTSENKIMRSKTSAWEQEVPHKDVHKSNSTVGFRNDMQNGIKEGDKPKSMYKMIASKFTRSVSNLGDNQKPLDGNESDKFKLKRPSRFLKNKVEHSSSKTSLGEVDEEGEKIDKKSKISNALSKFLGRKSEEPNKDVQSPQIQSNMKLKRNTKLEKWPTKKHDGLRQSKIQVAANEDEYQHNQDIDPKNYLYLKNNDFSILENSNQGTDFQQTQNYHASNSSCNGNGEISQQIDSLDQNEGENESVIDRITRKSYYTRFNENKRNRPKSARIESREAEDQQLAAAKARLFQEEQMNPSQGRNMKSLNDTSPLSTYDGIVRRSSVKLNTEPRITSLPPDEYYNSANSLYTPVQNAAYRGTSIASDPYGQHSYSKSAIEESRPHRRQSSLVDDTATARRLSLISREDPSACVLSCPSLTKEDSIPYVAHVTNYSPTYRSPQTSHDYSRCASGQYPGQNTFHRSFSHLENCGMTPREAIGYKRFSSMQDDGQANQNPSHYQNIYYQDGTCNLRSSNQHCPVDPSKENYYENLQNYYPHYNGNQIHSDHNTNIERSEFHPVPDMTNSMEPLNYDQQAVNHGPSQNIPEYLLQNTSDATFNSAREELNKRLAPLTRFSSMSSEIPKARPYRKTNTAGNLPLHYETATIDRFPYRRNVTTDLQAVLDGNHPRQAQDYSRRFSNARTSAEPEKGQAVTVKGSPQESVSKPPT